MAGGSFVFPHQQQPGRSDQQQQRDQQQRQPSPQDRWWATVNALSPARQQSLPPPLPPLPPMTSQQQQQLSSQLQSLPQPLPNIRHRRGSSALNSQASGNQASASTHSSSGRGQRSPGASGNSRQTNNNNTSSSSAGGGGGGGSSTGGQQQQQQNGGLRKGPAGLLVGLWKVLTSYLQVRAFCGWAFCVSSATTTWGRRNKKTVFIQTLNVCCVSPAAECCCMFSFTVFLLGSSLILFQDPLL